MAKHTYADIMAQQGRGFARGSLTPEQAKVAYQVRQHPEYTLHEAKVEAGVVKAKYTKKDLTRMAEEVPWESLTPSQKKLVKGIADRPVTANDIANSTGFTPEAIRKRIVEYRGIGINPSTLVYKASRGFYAKTYRGKVVIFYVIASTKDASDFMYMFGTSQAIEKSIREKTPCPSPPCEDENEASVAIPLWKKGEQRDNLSDRAKEIEA